jgi:putative ATP-binding cassette transporter
LPNGDRIVFLPQHPFLPEGTLRAALSYPSAPDAFRDTDIEHALECTGLAWLAPRLDDEDNWEQALPLRAQQRAALARALLHRPAWLFLEEATSAFEPDSEQRVFEMLNRQLPDATLLTISVHPGLKSLHNRELMLTRMREAKSCSRGVAATGAAIAAAAPR